MPGLLVVWRVLVVGRGCNLCWFMVWFVVGDVGCWLLLLEVVGRWLLVGPARPAARHRHL